MARVDLTGTQSPAPNVPYAAFSRELCEIKQSVDALKPVLIEIREALGRMQEAVLSAVAKADESMQTAQKMMEHLRDVQQKLHEDVELRKTSTPR